MHFTDDQAAEVKTWVVKRLEDMYVYIHLPLQENWDTAMWWLFRSYGTHISTGKAAGSLL